MYKIVRHYQGDKPNRTVATRLSLEEAQEWCHDNNTSSSTATSYTARKRTRDFGPWFDGYTET